MDLALHAVAELFLLTDPTDGSTRDLALRLRHAKDVARRLKDATDALELELAARLESDITTLSGVGIVRRGYTRRSQWRDPESSADLRHDVGEAVCKHVALDVGTGEIDPLRRNIARATVEALYDVIPAFTSVKQPAKRYGIQIDEYRRYQDVPVITVEPEEEP